MGKEVEEVGSVSYSGWFTPFLQQNITWLETPDCHYGEGWPATSPSMSHRSRVMAVTHKGGWEEKEIKKGLWSSQGGKKPP